MNLILLLSAESICRMDLGADMLRFLNEEAWPQLQEFLKEGGSEVVEGALDPLPVDVPGAEPTQFTLPHQEGFLDEDLFLELEQILQEVGDLEPPYVDEVEAESTAAVILPQPDHGQSGGYSEWLYNGAPHQEFEQQTPQMVAPMSWQPSESSSQAGLLSQGQVRQSVTLKYCTS